MIARMGPSVDPALGEGYDALKVGDARRALEIFAEVLTQRGSGSAFEGLGVARYLLADYRGAVAAHEQAYAAYRQEEDRLAAARAARMLAWMSGNVFGEWAVRAGWLARAKTLLAEVDEESAEQGWLLMLDAETDTAVASKLEHYVRAHELGRRFGDRALEFEALGWLGLQRALDGEVAAGLQLLDEALAAVIAGEVDDLYVVEGTFCGLFWVCERFHDVTRAEQWMRAAQDMLRRRNLIAVGAYCRAHYGGILTAAGRWAEADAALTDAVVMFETGYAALKSMALVRLADLRVRQGRLEDAGRLLHGLDQHPDAARPLAMLNLAQGNLAVAREVLERRLADGALDADIAGPLWALLAEVQVAQQDLEAATASVDRVAAIAAARPELPFLVAAAAFAHGQLCLASGDHAALTWLREALSVFSRTQAPADVARVRLELAKATADDNPDVAIAEATAALETYRRLDAARQVDAAASFLRFLGIATPPGPRAAARLTVREAEVLELLGEGLSNVEIAARLFLSRKTVEHHVSRVLSKLGVRNRVEAATHAALARAKSGSS